MNEKAKIYCIYNAEGSIFGEIRYLYNKFEILLLNQFQAIKLVSVK